MLSPPSSLLLTHPTSLLPLPSFDTRLIRSIGCRYHPKIEVSHVHSGSLNSCHLVLRRKVRLVQNPVNIPVHCRVTTKEKVSPPPTAFRRLTKFALCYGLSFSSTLSGLCHRASCCGSLLPRLSGFGVNWQLPRQIRFNLLEKLSS